MIASLTVTPEAAIPGPSRRTWGQPSSARRSRAVAEHRRIVAARGRRSDHGILGAGDAVGRVVIWDADVRY
jgi:hypothetical protein